MTIRMNLAILGIIVTILSVHRSEISYAQTVTPDASGRDPNAKPYDAQIFQLSELLGAVHYLRELCGADEGQVWRQQMRELVNSEGTSALRRARLVDSFNKGYRGYAQTYRTCTRPALLAIDRFMQQGGRLADSLVQDNR